jgi:hypothetical protein
MSYLGERAEKALAREITLWWDRRVKAGLTHYLDPEPPDHCCQGGCGTRVDGPDKWCSSSECWPKGE